MAYGSQKTNTQALTDITGLVHEIFTEKVLPSVRWESVTAQLFQNASGGDDYRYDGESLNGATDLLRPHGALGTDGALPDSSHQDAGNWQTTPVRRYVRRAVDNYVESAAVKGPGSFDDLGQRLFDQMWGAWKMMEIRQAVGGSNGYLCSTNTRTSATVVIMDDGLNHVGNDPLLFLDEGMVIAWIDASNSNAVGGAGKISSIAYSTNTVTFAASIENGTSTPTLAANDLWVAATTTDPVNSDYFQTEFQNSKNGLFEIVDPNAAATTVFNISQTTFPRWKPFREASSTWDHIEVTEHIRKLRAKSTAPVGPDSHTVVLQGAPYAELARTLVGFQQMADLGKKLEGGYETIRVSGVDFAVDDFQLQNVMYCLCMEDLYTVSLVEAGHFDEDGSMYERISDFDGKEWFVRDYCNSFSPRRNRHGALTGITLSNVTASDFSPTPNY